MCSLSPSPCFCLPFILCSAEGIGAARRLCSSVIRKGGREGASQQDSLFYIHQKSCLWFAPSLTCDTVDCSTTLQLRKLCTYPHCRRHRPKAPTVFPSLLPSVRWCTPCPHQTIIATTVLVPHPPLSSHPQASGRELIHFSIIIDITARLKSSDFRQGHPRWEHAPPPPHTSRLGEWGGEMAWLTSSKKKNTD